MDRISKYDILGELGQGGMGTVYKGRDPVIDRHVAIKVIHERALQNPSIKKRFYREARSAGRLSHPNITTIYEVGEAEGWPYLVMEYLEGSDLRSNAGTPLTYGQKLSIAVQICSGLQYAHENEVIHRDIKPANIRVLPDGTIKIMDFGIAQIQSETTTLTEANMGIGTPHYMSPEQIQGEQIDHRTDIFSFGVLFYELLTGINPFAGDNITTIIYKILNTEPKPLELVPYSLGKKLQRIVAKCLAKDPDERYASFEHVLRDLQTISIQNEAAVKEVSMPTAVSAPPSPSPPRRSALPGAPSVSKQRRSFRKGLWITLGIVLVAGLAAGTYFAIQSDFAFLSDFIRQPVEDLPETQAPLPPVTAVTITPSEVSIEVGERAFLNVELQNAQGEVVEPQDLESYIIQWRSADTTIAVVTGASLVEGGNLGSVTGRKQGGTTIAVVVDQVMQFVPVKVGVSSEVMAEAEQKHAEASAHLQDAALSDSVVLSYFEAIRDSFDYVLDADRLVDVEQKIQQLSALIELFIETGNRHERDTLTILQKQANWQAFVDQAFRQSPATQLAGQRVLEIDEVLERSATLEQGSFTTCDRAVQGGSTGALRICRDSAVADRFAPGTSVYFNAKVNAPRRATIRWEWLDPEGTVVKDYSTRVAAVQGYRIWSVLNRSDIQGEGKYEIRIYNERDLLIGRRPFTIR